AEKKQLQLKVEVPVEEMARLGDPSVDIPSGPASSAPGRASIWPAIHPRLLELIRAHRSTLIFGNSRRLAERMAAAINELAVEPWNADELFAAIRGAAPFAELSRTSFDGVLDMLSGLYPSDEFAELRPRVTWDRVTNTITARPGAKQVAIISGGTIPDRGLFGVFLAGAEKGSARVGELDEEMVFESR